jgi:hypothetical protein
MTNVVISLRGKLDIQRQALRHDSKLIRINDINLNGELKNIQGDYKATKIKPKQKSQLGLETILAQVIQDLQDILDLQVK